MSEEIYNRNSYIQFDANGNDPLSDKLINKFKSIPYSTTYLIQSQNEFRADKISALFYGDSNLYWVILEYNNLTSNNQLVSGKTINIPDIRFLNNLFMSSNKIVQTKNIYIK
jgi:nucleoid-associated protein YgaU